VAAIAGLALAGQFLNLRLASQLTSGAGLREFLIALVAAWLFAVPLLLSLRRGLNWVLGAFSFYTAAFLAVTLGVPPGQPGLPAGGEVVSPRPPSVLLIVLDTLRADAVSRADDPAGLTPNLARFSEEAIDFRRAYATAPWTAPSFGSLATSVYPSRHHMGEREPGRGFKYPLAEELPTLAEVFSAAGYWTGAVLTNGFLSRRFGMDRGFLVYEDLVTVFDYHPALFGLTERGLFPWRGQPYVIARDQTARIQKLVRWGQESGRPFFVLAQYMDPHYPYRAPEKLGNAPRECRDMLDHYRAEVAYCDFYLGELLAWLQERQLYDDLLIVVTSDHGEEFFESRWDTEDGERAHDHGHTLFDELLHVPLLIKRLQGQEGGGGRTEYVSLLDVPPTILALAGLSIPDDFAGRPLFAAEASPSDRVLMAEGMLYGAEQKAAMRGADKVIVPELPPSRELAQAYDRRLDPGEVLPLDLAAAPARFDSLFSLLAEYVRGAAAPAGTTGVEIDPRLRQQLRSVGYLE